MWIDCNIIMLKSGGSVEEIVDNKCGKQRKNDT